MSSSSRPNLFSRLTIAQKGMVLVLVPVFFEIIFAVVMSVVLANTADDLEDMEHSKNAILALHRIQNTATNSFMIILSPVADQQQKLVEVENMRDQFRKSETWAGVDLSKFSELKDVFEEAEEARRSIISQLEECYAALLSGRTYHFDRSAIFTRFMDMHHLSERTLAVEQKVRDAEPQQMAEFLKQTLIFSSAGIAASVVLSFGLAALFTNDIVERLKRIKDGAFRLAAGADLEPPEQGRDEIAMLEQVFYQSSQDLKVLRERELAILDNAADVICSIDSKLRFVGVSAALTKIWGYDQQDLLGKSLVSILKEDDVEDARLQLQAIAEGKGEGEVETIVKLKDGSFRNCVWTVKWSRREHQYYCVVHDVTEIRSMQELKQKFVSIAGHDLRAPLASVSISLERLVDGSVGEMEERTRNEFVKTQAVLGRLMELVNELLELEKLEAGKLVLAADVVSAFDICQMSCETLEAMARKSNITFARPKGDYAILGDERRLVQTVTNLLSNAIKFSPLNSTITLSLSKHEDLVEIRITDQGPGISIEDQRLIFDKFRQTRISSGANIKGTGLGLAIVKAIAEAHGGKAGVESKPGHGSAFWIRVPEYKSDGEDEP